MARVLLLGVERHRAGGLKSLLTSDGHDVLWSRSTSSWRAQEREMRPDVVVAAVASADGVLAAAKHAGRPFAAPLLFVQQEGEFLPESYLEERLVDRLSSPFMGDELLARVDALVRVRRIVGGQPPAGKPRSGVGRYLTSWVQSRLPQKERPVGPYLEVGARVAEWADRRDAFEPGHAARVTSFCAMIAEGLGVGEEETNELLQAARLHDIGKVALPIEVLHQRKPLCEAQRRLIRTHPARGAALLRALDSDDRVARVVLCHHERPDGKGYYGKPADGVPRSSLALAVAETFDAMTSSLLGRTVEPDRAVEILRSQAGDAVDQDCVEALAGALKPRSNTIPLAGA